MKKVLAIVLALVMMFAVCVPAFAADKTITNETADPKQDTVVVKTTFTTADEKWSVSFPAEIPVAWGDSSAQLCHVNVATQLTKGAQLKVAVSEDATNGNVMKATDATITDTLSYTLANNSDKLFGSACGTFNTDGTVNTYEALADEDCPTVTVDFSSGTIAEYVGNVTYTATYVSAA